MINPLRAAALRRRAILGLDNTGSTGLNYTGAQYSRQTQDWIWAPIASADQEARWDMARLRARARELARNNPQAVRYLSMCGENVVGEHGMRFQARVQRPGGKLDISINDAIEASWGDWCMPENADAAGRASFVDQEWSAIVACARDGEALFRKLRGFPNEFGFALQQIDIDRLDHTLNRPPGARENEIRMGVEVDEWGRPVNYWLWTRHPYDLNGSGTRHHEPVPADEIIYLGRQQRPGQTRDVTWFAPVMLPMRMLGGFAEAELVAARMGASSMGFFIQDEDGVEDADSPAAGEDQGAGMDLVIDAEPGTMTVAPAGIKDFKQFAPGHPNVEFSAFVKSMIRWIAGGLSVSYNGLGNDLESVNYSSIRAGLISERDHWRRLQYWMALHFHRPIYREWLKWALAAGAVELPARNVSRWFDHRFMPRGWSWVDPLKDVTADAAALQLALGSRTKILGEQGEDFEEILHDQREEAELAAAYGIPLVNVIGNARITEQAQAPSGDVPPTDGQDDAATAKALADILALRQKVLTNGHGG